MSEKPSFNELNAADKSFIDTDYLYCYDTMCLEIRQDTRKLLYEMDWLYDADDEKKLRMVLPVVIDQIAEILKSASSAECTADALKLMASRIMLRPLTEAKVNR